MRLNPVNLFNYYCRYGAGVTFDICCEFHFKSFSTDELRKALAKSHETRHPDANDDLKEILRTPF